MPTDTLASLYRSARVEPDRRVTGLIGPTPTGPAVVVVADDIKSALHHAAARRLAKDHPPA